MHTITLTRANIGNTENNLLVYDIPGSKNLEGSEIALSTLYMYYAWENINAAPLANNFFYISWPSVTDGGGNTEPDTLIQITIPDGIYEVSDLNSFMQQFFITNNLYLINSTTGEYVYFMQMQVNPTRYGLQFNSFSLPTSLPAGYTAPAAGFCVTPLLPSITAVLSLQSLVMHQVGLSLETLRNGPALVQITQIRRDLLLRRSLLRSLQV
jgi:hypothetical protein